MQIRKFYLAHNACFNSSFDLNVLEAGLRKHGFDIVDTPELADIIIYSGCSVRQRWVDDAVLQLNEVEERAPGTKTIVTGCLASTSFEVVRSNTSATDISSQTVASILRTYTGLEFAEVDQEFSQNSSASFEKDGSEGLQNLRKRVGIAKASIVADLQEIDRRHGSQAERAYRQTTKGFVFYDEQDPSEVITVARSCPYQCSFCNIPQGRGEFVSTPLSSILSKAKNALDQGNYHLILMGDEIGNYRDKESHADFPTLIKSLLALSPELTLSIRYIEPKPFLRYSEEIFQWCIGGKIRLLYISVQSGSRRILKAMNRGYDIDRLTKELKRFRQLSPVVFYGNWLVGFPGETEEDFSETVSLTEELKFHISVAIPFSSRENTPAEKMDNHLDKDTIEERVYRLTNVIANLKASAMESVLGFLDADSQRRLADRIREAECEQYVDDQENAEPLRVASNRIDAKQL